MNPFLKKPKDKAEGLFRKPGSPSSFPVPFVIFMSLFVIIVTLLGFRQIRDTMITGQSGGNPNPSFEKTMLGVLAMESYPDLRISKDQADKIMSVIGHYMQYPDIFGKLESAASVCLDERQKKFITKNSGRSFNPGVKHQIPPGYTRIEWIYRDLEKYAEGTEVPIYGNTAENTAWLNPIPGIEDLAEGIYHLKQAGKLTKPQAAYLTPYLKETAEVFRKTDESKEADKAAVLSFLNDRQREFLKQQREPVPPDFIKTYMPDIIKLLGAKRQ
jgi:hypothetical protein